MKMVQWLDGTWEVSERGGESFFQGEVPGTIHADLLRQGFIEDPFFRKNELNVLWVAEKDWTYARTFEVSADFLEQESIQLCCEGLDTLAEIVINGHRVGTADNMFRSWVFEVRPFLQEGMNHIEVRFSNVLAEVRRRQKARPLQGCRFTDYEVDGRSHLRKEPCNFGWDWGPGLVTCGIWRSIYLRGVSQAVIAEVPMVQHHEKRRVVLEGRVVLDRAQAGLHAAVSVSFSGREVAAVEVPVSRGRAPWRLCIDEPQLWWPNDMGAQALYQVRVCLMDAEDNELDVFERRVGLRTLTLETVPDERGESFALVVNGQRFFTKGSNWIPPHAIRPDLAPERVRGLLESARDAHQNLIRVWGGGVYESDEFYDHCDELGLCVWQDFMFACAAYPTDDPDFRASSLQEAEDNLKRLRHHPCLALLCGNNELEMHVVGDHWPLYPEEEYKSFFDRDLRRVCHQHAPQLCYWPGSPHAPGGSWRQGNVAHAGDSHLWDVWHGGQPFEWFRGTFPRFCSEFGFQSFPEPRTISAFALPQDENLTAPVMEFHQRSWAGNPAILKQMLDWFRMPSSFEQTVWLSQIQQGLAIKYAVEHWRRNQPQCMGAIYWQLNDCWPAASWSSIDFFGRWKALHYMARRFFAPLQVSGVERVKEGKIDVFVTHDAPRRVPCTIRWRVTDVAGALLQEGSKNGRTPASGSRRVVVLDLNRLMVEQGPANLLVWVSCEDESGTVVSQDLLTLCRPKQIEWLDPEITFQLKRGAAAGTWNLTLNAKHPAAWVWISHNTVELRAEDNFFCLPAGQRVLIELKTDPAVKAAALRKELKVQSLYDTFEQANRVSGVQ